MASTRAAGGFLCRASARHGLKSMNEGREGVRPPGLALPSPSVLPLLRDDTVHPPHLTVLPRAVGPRVDVPSPRGRIPHGPSGRDRPGSSRPSWRPRGPAPRASRARSVRGGWQGRASGPRRRPGRCRRSWHPAPRHNSRPAPTRTCCGAGTCLPSVGLRPFGGRHRRPERPILSGKPGPPSPSW